jgi:hypothetical protein
VIVLGAISILGFGLLTKSFWTNAGGLALFLIIGVVALELIAKTDSRYMRGYRDDF